MDFLTASSRVQELTELALESLSNKMVIERAKAIQTEFMEDYNSDAYVKEKLREFIHDLESFCSLKESLFAKVDSSHFKRMLKHDVVKMKDAIERCYKG